MTTAAERRWRGPLSALLLTQAMICAPVVLAFAIAGQFVWASVFIIALGLLLVMLKIVRDRLA